MWKGEKREKERSRYTSRYMAVVQRVPLFQEINIPILKMHRILIFARRGFFSTIYSTLSYSMSVVTKEVLLVTHIRSTIMYSKKKYRLVHYQE